MKLLILIFVPSIASQLALTNICEHFFAHPKLKPVKYEDFFTSFTQKSTFYMNETFCYANKTVVHSPYTREWVLVWTNSTGLLRTSCLELEAEDRRMCSMHTLWKDIRGFLRIEENLWNLYVIPEQPSLRVGLFEMPSRGLERIYYLKNDSLTRFLKVMRSELFEIDQLEFYEKPHCDSNKLEKHLAMVGELTWEDNERLRIILFVLACLSTGLAILGAILMKVSGLLEFKAMTNRVVPIENKET